MTRFKCPGPTLDHIKRVGGQYPRLLILHVPDYLMLSRTNNKMYLIKLSKESKAIIHVKKLPWCSTYNMC